jgi:YegS/Rv2252/BmrU family lipid kinase
VARRHPDLRVSVAQAAQEAGVSLDWVETQAREHASQLAEQAAHQGYELVVAAGGDGTVNEVVNGLMRAGEKGASSTLGIIPVGSGNDFAWFAGVPLDPVSAGRRLVGERTRQVDVGHIRLARGRERYFANGCGIGFDGRVSLEVERLRRLPGFLMYLVSVLRTIVLYHQAPRLRIRLDEQELIQPTMMLTVSNGRRHGGGFLVTPQAELDDGLFDVCLAGKLSRLGMLMVIPRFVRGTHVTHPQVRMTRARQVSVESPAPLAIHLDGEIFASDARQIQVRLLPSALQLKL